MKIEPRLFWEATYRGVLLWVALLIIALAGLGILRLVVWAALQVIHLLRSLLG